jgi:hypothetical protein
MKLMALALTAAVASSASAALTGLRVAVVTRTDGATSLDVYTVFAQFNGASDTVTNVGQLQAVGGASLSQFYHKDTISGNVGGFGLGDGGATWNPALTGNATTNRPFDSFVTIGTTSTGGAPGVSADPGWPAVPGEDPNGNPWGNFDRGSLPSSNPGWFLPGGSTAGRVGVGGNTNGEVRLGQFVIASGSNGGTFQLKVSWNPGTTSSTTSGFLQFNLPAPGAVALLGLAGLAGRRRR